MATMRLVPASGEAIEVTKDSVVVGRDPGADIVLADGSVSRKHARIEKRGEAWAVVDQASANGTFVDTQKVADVVLRDGQELRFGGVSFHVQIGHLSDLGATIAGESLESPLGKTLPPRPLTPPTTPVVVPPPPPILPTDALGIPLPPKPTAPPAVPPPPPVPKSAPPAPAPPPVKTAAPPVPPPPPSPRGVLPPRSPVIDAPPPAKKGKGPVFWGVSGCCGCLTLLILIVAIVFGSLRFMQKGAVDAAQGELSEIREGKIDQAYERLSSSYKTRLSREEFETLLSRHPVIRQNKDVNFSETAILNDTAHLAGTVTSASGETEKITVELQKEGSAWKIASLELWGGTSEGPGLRRLTPA